MGGLPPPPTPLLICRMLTELSAPLVESSLPRTSWGGLPPPPPTPPLIQCCACVKLCTAPCESAAPAANLVPLAKVLRPPRNVDRTLRKCIAPAANLYLTLLNCRTLHRTLRKCCACREIGTSCESAAPAAKCGPHLAQMYCTCRESVPDLAKLRLYLTFLTPLICTRLTVINAPFAESSLLRSSSPFVESSLLRASWGVAAAPPTPPLIFTMCTEITAPFAQSSLLLFFEHHGGGCPPKPPR